MAANSSVSHPLSLLHGSRTEGAESRALDLFTDTETPLEGKLKFLLYTCWIEVFLEYEKVAIVVEHDELGV